MPTTPSASAADARRRRRLRIAMLRRQVLAAALATFALAFALVAADGSMGSNTKKAAVTAAPATATPDPLGDASAQQFDDGSGDQQLLDGSGQQQSVDGAGVGASSADPVQTAQS